MASLQISQQSFESCPIAKSPQGSPNPQQPLKKSQDETFFWTKRTEKGQVSKSEAPSSPLAQSQGAALYAQANGSATDGQTAGWEGWMGREKLQIWPPSSLLLPRKTSPGPQGCPLQPQSLPMAFHLHQTSGNEIPVSAMIAQACVGHGVHVCSFNWHKHSYLHDGIQHKYLHRSRHQGSMFPQLQII